MSIGKRIRTENDTVKNGIYREFYENGRKSFEGFFKSDTLTGLAYYFNENGDSLKYYNNIRGDVSLPYRKWLNKGRVLIGDYSKDHKAVLWIWYNSKGNEIKKKINDFKKEGIVVPE